ncbi:hypothetical protein Nepgr_020904 [Nepenthes gracilis]|uniref:catalase n=1 Tax=Nepenthes gracilis TaxID=150966 RepID=A0AAD3XVN1_NEPGR|nr:hypothetical protein Nepgr_020904 [Nepenthes gracilis]
MASPLARITTHTYPNVKEIINFRDLSDDFFLTDKDQNKILVPSSVQLLLEMNSSIVKDGIALNSSTAVFGNMVEQDHTRGASATCFLEVMHDASYLTCFGFLWTPGSSEPMPDPFSPVSHEQGSPTVLQNPRGMAVQPSTNEGTCELVGHNSPMLFIHNIIRLPDVKPKIHIQDNWRIVDFFSHNPNSLHMFTLLFDTVGFSQAYKLMEDNLCC